MLLLANLTDASFCTWTMSTAAPSAKACSQTDCDDCDLSKWWSGAPIDRTHSLSRQLSLLCYYADSICCGQRRKKKKLRIFLLLQHIILGKGI